MTLDQVRSRRFLPLLYFTGAVAILSSTMSKNPVLNPFAESLGVPVAFMGLIAAASTVPGVLISLPAGSLSDVFGRSKVLLASVIIFASAPFLYIPLSSWWQLIIVRFYHGFATAIFVPVARAAIVEQYPSSKGEKISTFTSATVVGRSIAPFMGGVILSITIWNYAMLYLAVGAFGVTALITALFVLQKEGDPHERKPSNGSLSPSQEKRATRAARAWSDIVRNPGIVAASAVEAGAYYCYGAQEFFLSGYLKDVAQMDPSLIGMVLGMQLLLIPVVNPFMGRFSDKAGRKIPILLGLAVSGLPMVFVSHTTQFLPLLVISAVYGLGFSMVVSTTPALAGDLAGNRSYGAAMGFLATVMDVGQMLGPIVTGLILATFGYSGSFFSLGAMLLGFCVFFGTYGKLTSSPRIQRCRSSS